MKSPLKSNLLFYVQKVIDECYYNGAANVDCCDGYTITGEWVRSPKRSGFYLVRITISKDKEIQFVYDDYGTERRAG